MRLTTALIFLLATIAGACSKPNPDHCANQQGHTTCKARGGDTLYCSSCVAENNGCVAEPVTDACDAGSTSEPGTSTGDPSTTGSPTTSTTSTTDLTTSGDPSTTSSSTSTTGDPTTTTNTTGSSSESSSETTGSSSETSGTTFETSSGTTLDADTDTQSTEILDTTGTTTSETDDSTTGPFCGDNTKDPGETCDGTDISPFTNCVDKNMTKYGGGVLKCAANCNAYNEDSCCIATGQACPTFPQKCCKNPNALCLGNCG